MRLQRETWVRYTGKILSGEAQTALIESASFIWGKNVSSLPRRARCVLRACSRHATLLAHLAAVLQNGGQLLVRDVPHMEFQESVAERTR